MLPGRSMGWLSATQMLDRPVLHTPLHIIRGAHKSPTLALVSTLHGNEWHSTDAIKELLNRINLDQLSGTIPAVPVANPDAFGHFTRDAPGASDVADPNRVFLGGKAWINLQIASVFTEHALAPNDFWIDYHPGPWGSAI